ncbi:hypothetical protein GCM10023170_017300 [Phytohabitans houttuyneae]|uniref:DUF4352 domain-containing protein n=1 Tax=Phytohabitans houttuyneae TaxID=1076126 RepID=A0A6V8KVL3_9ACTN|nr:hypothetical protein Phou_100170 [Phytohabitans houttuyneae]
MDVRVLESPDGALFHFVTVTAKNIGTVALIDPRLSLQTEAWLSDNSIAHSEIGFDGWFEVSDHGLSRGNRFAAVDTGEVAEFSLEKTFESSVWAVRYVAILEVGRLSWSKHEVVENVKKTG